MRHEIPDMNVEVEVEDGPMNVRSLGVGRLLVTGPLKGFEDSDPYIRVMVGHDGEEVEWGDGTLSKAGDWATGSVHLTLEEAEELYEALGQALEDEPDVLLEDV